VIAITQLPDDRMRRRALQLGATAIPAEAGAERTRPCPSV